MFLLSPARIGGPRSNVLLRPEAGFDLAVRLRERKSTIGEAYGFISGLYFRGKLAYAETFAGPPTGIPATLVMVPGLGLLPPDTLIDTEQLRGIGDIEVAENNQAFRTPLLRDAVSLDQSAGPSCHYLLLGSIATGKYAEPLLSVFGDRLLFPSEFVGRGDMSRGGLMLRRAQSGEELSYIGLSGAIRRGRRPAKLEPLRKPKL
ncbi:MAG: hypothetical protein M3O20_08475 [Acidobacteriota bacterium]|nr:hypothetical protein [Acidobacteriota bacterium]